MHSHIKLPPHHHHLTPSFHLALINRIPFYTFLNTPTKNSTTMSLLRNLSFRQTALTSHTTQTIYLYIYINSVHTNFLLSFFIFFHLLDHIDDGREVFGQGYITLPHPLSRIIWKRKFVWCKFSWMDVSVCVCAVCVWRRFVAAGFYIFQKDTTPETAEGLGGGFLICLHVWMYMWFVHVCVWDMCEFWNWYREWTAMISVGWRGRGSFPFLGR